MVANSPLYRERSTKDALPENFDQTIRLRRIARKVSQILSEKAENLGFQKYCTVVFGSVAKGLVRPASDIDLDLIVDSTEKIENDTRDNIRQSLIDDSRDFGVDI